MIKIKIQNYKTNQLKNNIFKNNKLKNNCVTTLSIINNQKKTNYS